MHIQFGIIARLPRLLRYVTFHPTNSFIHSSLLLESTMAPLWYAPTHHHTPISSSSSSSRNVDMRPLGRSILSTAHQEREQSRSLASTANGNRWHPHCHPPPHSGLPRNGPPSMQGRQYPSGIPHPSIPMPPPSNHGPGPTHSMASTMPSQMYNKPRFAIPPFDMRLGPEGGPSHSSNMMRQPSFQSMHHLHPQGLYPPMIQQQQQQQHSGAPMIPYHAPMRAPPNNMTSSPSGPEGQPMTNHRQMPMRPLPLMQHGQVNVRPNGNTTLRPSSHGQISLPLRESRAHNVQIKQEFIGQKHQDFEASLKANPPDPAPSQQTEATLDAASILLGLRTTASPTPSVPLDTRDDSPKPEVETRDGVFPTRLALPDDENKLNSMHCFLRAELLELFVVELKPGKKDELPKVKDYIVGSSCGRVGLRCIHCAHARKMHGSDGEAPMAVFYPKSISELYRLVTSWQRVHLRKCRNLPPTVHETYTELKKNDKTRGKTQYWVTSARELGLIDCHSKAGGIRFSPE